jgi:hypothetical protein
MRNYETAKPPRALRLEIHKEMRIQESKLPQRILQTPLTLRLGGLILFVSGSEGRTGGWIISPVMPYAKG